MISGYESFNAAQGAVAFLGCRHALSLPPIPHVQLTQSPACSGFSRFAETLLCDFQLMFCIALADSTPNNQLILLSLLGIPPWVYEGQTIYHHNAVSHNHASGK